jgi:predicted RNA-binding protein Jag
MTYSESSKLQDCLVKLIELMGFEKFSVHYDVIQKRFSIFISEEGKRIDHLIPDFVANLDYLVKLITKRQNMGLNAITVDINNYRKERENLILDLARGAARRATVSKQEVVLPAMNAYERRLIHLELATRPDVKTESVGEGKNRHIVVRPIIEN